MKEKIEIREALDTKPSNLSKLLLKASEIKENSLDYLVTDAYKNVRFNESAGLTFRCNEEVYHSELSRFALGQLGSKIGVPTRYLDKCIESGRIDLAQDNVNSWLQDYKKPLFLREYKGMIRGVLSDRYSVCDSDEILGVLNSTIDTKNYKIKGSFLNEERLHLRLVGNEMIPINGEDLFPGIFIDSSDVGRSILTVRFGIYKLVCTNGLIISKASGVMFEQKHIGISTEEFHRGLEHSLNNIDMLVENSIYWVNESMHTSAFNNLSIFRDSEEVLQRIRQKTNMAEESAKKVVELMQTRYDESRWGLINSITEVAQDFTLEKRLDYERIAGNLLVA